METVTVKQLQAILHLSANGAYMLCRQPGFPVIRVGRKILIPADRLQEWINGGGTTNRITSDKRRASHDV